MAKDILTRYMRMYVGGYDLSGDSRSFATALNTFDQVEMSGVAEATRYFIAGHREIGIMGYQALMNDTSGQAFDQLKDAENSSRLSLVFGTGGTPAQGDPAYLMASVQLSDAASLSGGGTVLTTDFKPDGSQTLIENPLGRIQAEEQTFSATANDASVDWLAQTTNGAHANLHITATVAGNFSAIKIQDSANNADWVDLITFSADGSAVTSEQGTATGTVDRYTRVVTTRTGGTFDAIITLARN